MSSHSRGTPESPDAHGRTAADPVAEGAASEDASPRPEEVDAGAVAPRPLVVVEDLVKDYGDKVALHGVSFSIDEGEIFGFIGPNGAGKTTTIRILATLLEATSGEVSIDGLCVREDTEEVRRIIGYMPDSFGVYEGLTVEEYVDFFARAYRIPHRIRQASLDDVLELTDLAHLRHRMVSDLSKGMKQRLCLAKTLMHDPKLLILDEPASALDPRARIELRGLLKELRAMGKTILISSHILTELSDLCTSVGIIEAGRLVRHGSLAELEAERAERVHVCLTLCAEHAAALPILRERKDVVEVQASGVRIEFDWLGKDQEFYRLVHELTGADVPILSVERARPNLENVFLELTQGELQ